jgi:broad specificity phosphatase PhoE
MDVTGIAKLATSLADTGTRQDVAIAVMKKAQDIQATAASQMIEALQTASPAPNLPPHLGNHINTTA